MSIKLIITGATGFVGEGVLLECLQHPAVSEVLMINRKHFDLQHPKLEELIAPDFFRLEDFSEKLKGYDACFYCAGISSAGVNEKKYTHVTYDTTVAFAASLHSINEGLTFCFVSGSHTDSSEAGKIMWARVKGKTENALMRMNFKQQYNFRPGGMIPTPGQRNAKTGYKIIVKLMALVLPKRVSTVREVGLAMINAVLLGYSRQIVEIDDIKKLAGK